MLPPSRLGVDTSVTVARTIQPGSFWTVASPLGSTPVIRKSFRRYWFSLKTALRDGRSATHAELETPARTRAPARSRTMGNRAADRTGTARRSSVLMIAKLL